MRRCAAFWSSPCALNSSVRLLLILSCCLPVLAFCDSGSGQHPEEFQGNAYHSLKIIALLCLAYARSASNPRTASGATVCGLNGLRLNAVHSIRRGIRFVARSKSSRRLGIQVKLNEFPDRTRLSNVRNFDFLPLRHLKKRCTAQAWELTLGLWHSYPLFILKISRNLKPVHFESSWSLKNTLKLDQRFKSSEDITNAENVNRSATIRHNFASARLHCFPP